jgi:hypothetical protein
MMVRRMELRRIGVFSTIKTSFLVGGLSGLILGVFQWGLLGAILASLQDAPSVEGEMLEQAGIGGLLGPGLGAWGVFLPLIGAIGGVVGGVIGGFFLAVLYNLSARLWGGLEMDWSEMSPAARSFVTSGVAPFGSVTPLPGEVAPGRTSGERSDDERPATGRYE